MSYKSNAIPTERLAGFLCSYRQANPKIHVELQGTPKSEMKPVDLHFPISTLTHQAPSAGKWTDTYVNMLEPRVQEWVLMFMGN